MPDEEEGTTEFRARGLKDLLESQEAPAKPAGGDQNRRMMMIGGGVGAVVVVILAVVLLGGGGDNGGGNNGGGSGVPVGLEFRPSAAVGIQPGASISICDSASGAVAEGVVAKEIKPAKSASGQDIVQLTVLAEGSEINALGPTKAKSTWRAISSPTCPPVETTATTTTTTLPVVQPPASTPPDSTPTPPPS